MIQLLLSVILVCISSWPAWGSASDPINRTFELGGVIEIMPSGPPRVVQRAIVNTEYEEIVTCNYEGTHCWTPCEMRMREVMRSANTYLKGSWNTVWKESAQWEQTMKSCVEGK